MVAVITAVVAGSAVGLLAAVVSAHSLAAALTAGSLVAAASLALMRYQDARWQRAALIPIIADQNADGRVPDGP